MWFRDSFQSVFFPPRLEVPGEGTERKKLMTGQLILANQNCSSGCLKIQDQYLELFESFQLRFGNGQVCLSVLNSFYLQTT